MICGRKHTKETKEIMRKVKLGNLNPMWNKKHTYWTKQKMSRMKLNEKNPNWKGNDISESGGRRRAWRWYKNKKICEYCNAKKTEIHHIDGKTSNNALNNIKWLCRRCHMIEDNRINQRDKNGRFI